MNLFSRSSIIILSSITILILIQVFLFNYYLGNNFSYSGGAYFKGAGHLLRENLKKGMGFLIADQFSITLLLSLSLFFLLEHSPRKIACIAISILSTLFIIFILIYKFQDIYELIGGEIKNNERTLHFITTWIFRLLGVTSAYFYINTVLKKRKQHLPTIANLH